MKNKKDKQKIVKQYKGAISRFRKGMVFAKDNHVYTLQMIISNKIMPTSDGIYRECIAWNPDMCRRFDTTEEELKSSKYICEVPSDALDKYVKDNKGNEWSDPKVPVFKLPEFK